MKLLTKTAALAAAALSLAACANFDRQWKAGAAVENDRFAGRYEGRWTSQKHHNSSGRLQCVLTRTDSTHYQAKFHAEWVKFSSNYDVALSGTRSGNDLLLSGSHDLPKIFGGTYRYLGRVTGDRFHASYDSAYDMGSFDLTRVR